MARFYGAIGYAVPVEHIVNGKTDGTWTDTITERNYSGDIRKVFKKNENGEGTHENMNISNEISILADGYAMQHLYQMRYICWAGAKWNINSAEVERPRIRLSIGGLYNGEQA